MCLKNRLQNLIESHIPLTPVRAYSARKSPLRCRTKRLIAHKQRLWRLYKAYPSVDNLNLYRVTRNACNSLVRLDRRQHQVCLSRKFVQNPKALYKHFASLTKVKPGVSPLLIDGTLTDSNLRTADALCDAFHSVFTTEPLPSTTQDIPPSLSHHTLPDTLLNLETISKKLQSLRPFKSAGLDGIPPFFLKSCAHTLAPLLLELFTHSLETCTVPSDWKLSVITPIYKKGDRSDPSNYRPVSLLPTCSKVLESIIDDHIRLQVESRGLLHPSQHGFRQRHSCTTNLTIALDDWTKAVDHGSGVDVVYFDFSKAFDRVCHSTLLLKLTYFDLGHGLVKWIQDYLQDRYMCVRVYNNRSHTKPVLSGVPQGSILGPLLFILFLNDLPSRISSSCLIYADDVKIWRKTTSDGSHRASLQRDIDQIGE